MCVFPCLGRVIHCPWNTAPPNLEEQIKLIRGKRHQSSNIELLVYRTYRGRHLRHWVCSNAWVSNTHIAVIIMSYVRRNVSNSRDVLIRLRVAFGTEQLLLLFVTEQRLKLVGEIIEISPFCWNNLRGYNSSEITENWRAALFGCATRINTAVTQRHTHPFPWLQEVWGDHWTLGWGRRWPQRGLKNCFWHKASKYV